MSEKETPEETYQRCSNIIDERNTFRNLEEWIMEFAELYRIERNKQIAPKKFIFPSYWSKGDVINHIIKHFTE